MQLRYPINFIGYEDDETSGDVVTSDGEFLGVWNFTEDAEGETGVISFTPDGATEPLFEEVIAFLTSGLLSGMALSKICRSIRLWNDGGKIAPTDVEQSSDA
jgi:hypothetical protein